MTQLIELPIECPVLPGYFFCRNGTFSVGTPDGPYFKGYPSTIRGKVYRRVKTVQGEYLFVHRMVAFTYCHNPLPDMFYLVDHINGVTEDNRDSNLRWVNYMLNSANSSARNTYICRKRPIKTKSGKTIWIKSEREPRWESRVTIDGVKHKLGYSSTEKQACHVSRTFRKEQFRKLYLGYLQLYDVSETEAPSLDIQHERPRKASPRSVLYYPAVQRPRQDRVPRFVCFHDSLS